MKATSGSEHNGLPGRKVASLPFYLFLIRLVWVCVLPLAALAVYLAVNHVLTLRAQLDQQAGDRVQNAANTMDRYLATQISGLQVLAASPLIDNQSRLGEFYREAEGFHRNFGDHVVLSDMSMQMLLNTRSPFGSKLPKLPKPKGHAAVPTVLATGKPSVGDSFFGPIAKERLVTAVVPVIRKGHMRFLLLCTMATRQFQHRLDQVALPSGWSLTLRDGAGEVMARSPAGMEPSPKEGAFGGHYMADVARSYWSVTLHVPRSAYLTPIIVTSSSLAAAILCFTLISTLLGRAVARRLTRSMESLVEGAPSGPSRPRIAEIETVRGLLDKAGTDREEAEAALRESERRFRRLFDLAPVPLCFVNKDGVLIDFNERFFTTFGYIREEIPTLKEWWALACPDAHYRRFVSEALQRALEWARETATDVEPVECQVTCASGDVRTILISSITVDDDLLATFYDITSLKAVEENLRESRAQLEAALANMTDAVSISDTGGRFINFNDAFAAFHRFRGKEECPGAFADFPEILDLFLPDGNPAPLDMWPVPRALRGEKATNAVYTLRRKDTGETWVGSYSFAPIRNTDDVIAGSVVVGRDITDFIRAEESLHRQAKRLRNLHETDMAILLALESPRVIAEEALRRVGALLSCRLARVSLLDAGTQELGFFASPADHDNAFEAEVIESQEIPGNLENLRQGSMEAGSPSETTAPPETVRAFRTIGIASFLRAPLFLERGLIGVLDVGWEDTRNITPEERETVGEVAGQAAIAIEQTRLREEALRYARELEARVAERTAQLEAANRELEAFSYSVSHDLRAPLRHISGYVDLLNRRFSETLSAKALRYLTTINDSAREMGVLIDNLLQFSRNSRKGMHKVDFDMDGLVREVLESIKDDAGERTIEWIIAPLPNVSGDRSLLGLVWSNLLSNALKFTRTREKAVIQIGVAEEEGEFVFLVRDNGAGFDMKYVHRLFGVFQRLHSVASFEGTGIGLANVRRIVLRHGGRTWAEGEPDKGAAFYFTLPKSQKGRP